MIAETAPVSSQGVAPHLIAWTGAVLLIQLVQKWLKEGYERAREIVREDEFMSGSSQGFVMGLLDWEWHTVVVRFGRFRHFQIYKMDAELNYIRVHAYNRGLAAGYVRGKGLSAELKKRRGSKKSAGSPMCTAIPQDGLPAPALWGSGSVRNAFRSTTSLISRALCGSTCSYDQTGNRAGSAGRRFFACHLGLPGCPRHARRRLPW